MTQHAIGATPWETIISWIQKIRRCLENMFSKVAPEIIQNWTAETTDFGLCCPHFWSLRNLPASHGPDFFLRPGFPDPPAH